MKKLPEFLATCLATDFAGHNAHSIYSELKDAMGKEEAFAVATTGNTLRSHIDGSKFSSDVALRASNDEIARAAKERAGKLAAEAAVLRIEIRVYLRGSGYIL